VVIDVCDEFVCESCGAVSEKQVIEQPRPRPVSATDFTRQALGGYLGSMAQRPEERESEGFSKSHSTYRYLKLISDYAGREDDFEYTCARLIERACEKLSLPEFVMSEAMAIMKKTIFFRPPGRRITSAAVSAFAVSTACKVEGVASVTLREIAEVHRSLGRRVKMSAIMRLSLDSPLRPPVRRPEDYLGRVLGKLGTHPSVLDRLAEEKVRENPYFSELRAVAKELIASVPEEEKAGHGPCALAATSLYAAEIYLSTRDSRKRRLTQRQLSDSGNTAEYTVRDQFREIFLPALRRSQKQER